MQQPLASAAEDNPQTTPRDVEAQTPEPAGKQQVQVATTQEQEATPDADAPFDIKQFFRHEWAIFYGMLKSSYLNWLLVISPIAIIIGFVKPHNSDVAIFILNFLALVPLALMLGDITEHLAARYGDVVGGLLNATFGNVVEIVLALQALRKGQYELVEMSLIGSVLSNLFLVLGCCFLAGGYKHHTLEFTVDTNIAQVSLLAFAIMAVSMPTAAKFVVSDLDLDTAIARISHCTALLLFFAYIGYLYFQLYTHPELCDEEEDDDDEEEGCETDEHDDLAPKVEEKQALKPIEEDAHPPHAHPQHLATIPSGLPLSDLENAGGAKGRAVGSARTTSGRTSARTPSGRPLEVIRTSSGRLMEMVRTMSGRLVEVNNKVWPEGGSDRVKTLSGRSVSGRTSNMSMKGSTVKVPRNELGLPMTEQEITELNRARRMSGRPALPRDTSVAARALAKSSSLLEPDAPTSVIVTPDEEEEEILSTAFALIVLTCISVLVALHCEFLTEVIQSFSENTGISQPFIAMIILPIAGNACEHLSAVFMAMKNRMNLALGIAVGSGLQISMLALPFICLIGWFINKPFLLAIDVFSLFATIASVVMTYIVIASGKCNWVYGLGPIIMYIIVATVYFYRTAPVDL